MTEPINALIDSVCRCVICGAKTGQCDCWPKRFCEPRKRKGKKCRNPIRKCRKIAGVPIPEKERP